MDSVQEIKVINKYGTASRAVTADAGTSACRTELLLSMLVASTETTR